MTGRNWYTITDTPTWWTAVPRQVLEKLVLECLLKQFGELPSHRAQLSEDIQHGTKTCFSLRDHVVNVQLCSDTFFFFLGFEVVYYLEIIMLFYNA